MALVSSRSIQEAFMERFKADAFDSPSRTTGSTASVSKAIPVAIATAQQAAAPTGPSRVGTIAARFSHSMAKAPAQLLKALGARLLTSLSQTLSPNDQPQVKWWRDAEGYDHYSVYDPVSQKTQSFDNAQQVRAWLEQRYYK